MFGILKYAALLLCVQAALFDGSTCAASTDTVELLSNPTPLGIRRSIAEGPPDIATSDGLVVFTTNYTASNLIKGIDYYSRIVAIFRETSDGYELEQTILPTIGFDNFSDVNVAVSGDHLAARLIGESDGTDMVAIYIYAHTNGRWERTASIESSDPDFGSEIEFAGDFLLVQDQDSLGGVRVYADNGTDWAQVDLLVPGSLIIVVPDTIAASDQYVVAFGRNDTDPLTPFVAVFERVNDEWTKVQELPLAEGLTSFGSDAAISGDLLVISNTDVETGEDEFGELYVYRRDAAAGLWELEQTLTAPGLEQIGESVDVSGNSITTANGAVFGIEFAHYHFDGATWQMGYTYRGEYCPDDPTYAFGAEVALESSNLIAAPHFKCTDALHMAAIGPINDAVLQDCNGNGFSDAMEIAIEITNDCNSNGMLDACEDDPIIDCNGNGICDVAELDNFVSLDCNQNGTPDECEPDLDSDGDGISDICDNCPDLVNELQRDCDGDGVGDVCAIASGLAEDCNADGVPDECTQSYPPIPELSAKFPTWWFLTRADGLTASVQPFTVQPGKEMVNAIGVWWAFTVPRDARLMVLVDPTQDGDLSDAVIAREVRTTTPVVRYGTETYPPIGWSNYAIEPAYIGEAGETFYIMAMGIASRFPVVDVGLEDGGRAGTIGFRYPNHFGLAHIDPATDVRYLPESAERRWAIRVTSTPVECLCTADIASSAGPDADGVINEHDLMALLTEWGECGEPCPPQCAADLTGNCRVDVRDLLVLLAQWGVCQP